MKNHPLQSITIMCTTFLQIKFLQFQIQAIAILQIMYNMEAVIAPFLECIKNTRFDQGTYR